MSNSPNVFGSQTSYDLEILTAIKISSGSSACSLLPAAVLPQTFSTTSFQILAAAETQEASQEEAQIRGVAEHPRGSFAVKG